MIVHKLQISSDCLDPDNLHSLPVDEVVKFVLSFDSSFYREEGNNSVWS